MTVSRQVAEHIERSNIGYYAGYGSYETRERVERLFRCTHPVLGSIKETGPLDPQKVLEIGIKRGEALADK